MSGISKGPVKTATEAKITNDAKWLQGDLNPQPVFINELWVFVYDISGCGFEFRCSHLNFRYRACFEHRVPYIQATIECGFTLKRVRDKIRTNSQTNDATFNKYFQYVLSNGF